MMIMYLRFVLLFFCVALGSQTAIARPSAATTQPPAAQTAEAVKAVKSDTATSRWMLTEKPVPGELSSPFGRRPDPVKRRRNKRRKRHRHHKGVDFVATRGTLVHAAGPGIVTRSRRAGGYGRMVIIDHGDGLQTRYAHLQRIKVKHGDFLPAGAVLGTVGSSGRTTGPHLHFEVRLNGVALPPEDVIQFKLPPCSRKARNCKRPAPRNT
jgi:murein DD-endopeptidase MepM/ murein hydrolase activator NlpD